MLTGATVAGTTDAPTEVTADPHPKEFDIQFILQEIRDYLSPDISGTYVCLASFYIRRLSVAVHCRLCSLFYLVATSVIRPRHCSDHVK